MGFKCKTKIKGLENSFVCRVPSWPFNSLRIFIYVDLIFLTKHGSVYTLLLLYTFKYLLAYQGYSYSTVTRGLKNKPPINCSAVSKKMPQKKCPWEIRLTQRKANKRKEKAHIFFAVLLKRMGVSFS